MLRRILYIGVLAFCLQHVFIITKSLGLHKSVYNHKPGVCSIVPGIGNGSEDIELLSDGLALISSGYLTLKERREGSPRGHIFALDFSDPDHKVIELKVTGDFNPDNLHPHGISVFEDKHSGKTYLFVVNHLLGFDAIEIFQFRRQTMTIKFVRSVRDAVMKSMNDVVAISPDEFYFTNDGRSLHPGIRALEQLARFRLGGVFVCDVTSCRQIGERLLEPNGIQLSRDRKYLFVSQPFEEAVQIFRRRDTDNGVEGNKPIQTIPLGTAPDNVFVDDLGDLWIGCHPVGLKSVMHMEDNNAPCPSQVIRVRFGTSGAPFQTYDLDEVYSEDGSTVSMVTTAVYYKEQLLLGSVQTRLLHCTVDVI